MATNTMESEAQGLKGKRPAVQHHPTQIGPMTFFLRSESELHHDDANRPARATAEDDVTASVADTSYGVQSLEDVMHISTETLSRTNSNESDVLTRKRRPGNPVHPKIYATGQRIVSNDQRRMSATTHLTPLQASPNQDLSPGTPRTNSIKSFQLSDEEISVTSETGSQAIHSSSSEEELDMRAHHSLDSPEPMLVMPSITMPQRRPFTQRGRRMGQMRIMVAGGNGLGKTSFLRNIFRLCEDIVHVDGMSSSTPTLATTSSKSSLQPTITVHETQASTKPLPAWWSDLDGSRNWWRRKSFSEGVLERNVRLVDTPGIDSNAAAASILKEVDNWLDQALHLDNLNDHQLLMALNGKAENFLDAAVYFFNPEEGALPEDELHLLQELSRRTSIIPVIAKADSLTDHELQARKASVTEILTSANVDTCGLGSDGNTMTTTVEVFGVSSLTDDGEVMDASTLMASSYLPPLRPSQLKDLVERLFEPDTIERLHHEAIVKFVAWRRQRLQSIQRTSNKEKSSLMPHPYSSYFRSISPSSDASEPQLAQSPYTLPQHRNTAPARHLHIAKWAQDLRRSLRREDTWRDDQSTRPTKGRLGGELAVIDPKDPLGILSMTHTFGARGWLALQVISGCGILSAAVWWMTRNYVMWQTWFWPSNDVYFAPLAIPAPTRAWLDNWRSV